MPSASVPLLLAPLLLARLTSGGGCASLAGTAAIAAGSAQFLLKVRLSGRNGGPVSARFWQETSFLTGQGTNVPFLMPNTGWVIPARKSGPRAGLGKRYRRTEYPSKEGEPKPLGFRPETRGSRAHPRFCDGTLKSRGLPERCGLMGIFRR